MGSQAPGFVEARRTGLLDFWTVYERVTEELQHAPVDVAFGLSELVPVVAARDLDQLVELSRQARGLLGRAIRDGEWQPYIEHARRLGARYAELGVGFPQWHAAGRAFHDRMIPALVEAYAATPARLTAALAAALALLDFWVALVAEPYFETRHEDRFQIVVDSIKDYAIFTLDPGGLVTSWNTGAQALNGYTADEIIGRHYTVFFPDAERQAGRPMHGLDVAATTGRFEEEAPRVRKDGSQFWADATITAIRAPGGTLIGFAKVVRDLTERRLAEAERRSLEERFRALAAATADAIVTADQHGAITYVNHATAAMFGATTAELVGQSLAVLMPERMRAAHRAGFARYLATHEPRMIGRTLELPALRRDGSELDAEMSIATWTAGGEPAFAAIIRDVSERKRIAATLEDRTRQLEERTHQLETTNREVEAFSYSAAHDLRAPLRSVSAFTQILLEDYADRLDREAVGYLTKIQVGVARMTALIDALLELARLSRSELEVKPVDLSAIAHAVVAQLAADQPDREVEVAIKDGLRALGDGRLIRTLLENLIGNAWKFTGKVAAPRIEVGSSDGRAFFVRDNGAGFDIAHARKLFSPFERLHTADDFPGTGVGLATVKRIIDRHGGRIWAQAQVGLGATFFFTLAATAG